MYIMGCVKTYLYSQDLRSTAGTSNHSGGVHISMDAPDSMTKCGYSTSRPIRVSRSLIGAISPTEWSPPYLYLGTAYSTSMYLVHM